ncbi:hypothetical protein LXA43DRAFT_1062885 [Ganoderma leucocontextum]|nr:hypothetical protein LXA43DRAFT_1062885 [Ganoderma leucocontextum]
MPQHENLQGCTQDQVSTDTPAAPLALPFLAVLRISMPTLSPPSEEELSRFVEDIISPDYPYHPSDVPFIIENFILLVHQLDGMVDFRSINHQYFSPTYRFLAQRLDDIRAAPNVLRQFAEEYSAISRRSRLRYLRWQRERAKEELDGAIIQSLIVHIAILRTDNLGRLCEMNRVKMETELASEKLQTVEVMCWDAFNEFSAVLFGRGVYWSAGEGPLLPL